jgi:hypothetical protein
VEWFCIGTANGFEMNLQRAIRRAKVDLLIRPEPDHPELRLAKGGGCGSMTSTTLASERQGVARRAGAATSAGAILATLLLPKCPLCIAVLLSSTGLGIAAARFIAAAARPGLWVLAAVSVLVVIWVERGRIGRRGRRDESCCAGSTWRARAARRGSGFSGCGS